MCAHDARERRESGSISRGCLTSLCLCIFLSGWFASLARAEKPIPRTNLLRPGLEWFQHEWRVEDPITREGDGLGPLFNARSCAGCHNQAGLGGGGAVEHNVQLLTARVMGSPKMKTSKAALAKRLVEIHPALENQSVVVLHRSSTSPQYAGWRNERLAMVNDLTRTAPSFRKPIGTGGGLAAELGGLVERKNRLEALFEIDEATRKKTKRLVRDEIALELTERNTPALFGDGLIDAIPDEVILAQLNPLSPEEAAIWLPNTKAQVAKKPGKASILPDGRVGKFGWKGQHASLRDFTLAACAVEVGLEVPGNSQAANPLKPNASATGLDMYQFEVDQLVHFIAQLPPPRKVVSPEVTRELVLQGELHFERVGCTNCHVPQLGEVEGIYSDLLLHDLGGSLAADGGYYGVTRGELANVNKAPAPDPTKVASSTEWRTPPLWGVADSAPYLHDGRAETLEAAIHAHEGTALVSKRAYDELSTLDKAALLWFLQTLRAPDPKLMMTMLAQAK